MNALTQPVGLPEGRADLLDRLVDGLGRDALCWLAGYTAALAREPANALPARVPNEARERITVLHGSQTGNARRTAERLGERLAAEGAEVRVIATSEYATRTLKDERTLLLVVSTQGDGEPPDDARAFVDFLLGPRAPRLPELRFAVLGLGDSTYPKFCEIGRVLDARLEALGAQRWLPRADADLDIDTVAAPWVEAAAAATRTLAPARSVATVTPLRPVVRLPDRDAPFAAPVLSVQRITSRDAVRDVRHVELSLAGSGLRYEPGDALGVWAPNAEPLVREWLDVLQLDGDTDVSVQGRTLPLRTWLRAERELTRLSRPFALAHAERAGAATLAARVADPSELAALREGTPPIDLLRRHPAEWAPEALVAALRPLTPRLYSIASSPLEVEDEVHLTIARVAFEIDGRARHGVASHHLAHSTPDDALRVFIEPNARFRLPADGSRDVLMIGAGTGIAPFRAFVQHRMHTGATGRNWLVFGAPRARSDFLYQLEWQQALGRGALHRLDLAFSRDQAERVYVQHRLREHGREVYAWLAGGAHLYVCGAVAMARDVHAALLDIATTHGAMAPDAAAAWLDGLLAEGRYARDAY